MVSLNQSVIRGLRWATLSRAAGQAFSWLSSILVIRLLSPADFGLAALAGIFAGFLLMLNEMGLSTTLIRWQIRDEETLRHVFGFLLVIGFISVLGLVLLAPVFGTIAQEPRIVPLLRFTSLQFITMAFAVIPQARLSFELRFKELSVIDFSAAIVGAVTTLSLAFVGAGAWSLIVGTLAIALTRAILLNFYCFSVTTPGFQFSKLRHLARFSGLTILQKSLWEWSTLIDGFIVGRALGVANLGIYGVGKQVASLPLERAMGIINSITLPVFSRVQSDLDQVRRGYLKLLRLGAAYAFLAFWGLALVSEPLVKLVLGTRWLASALVIQLICIPMPLRMLNAFTASAVIAINRQDVNIKSLLIAGIVIPSCVLVGTHWGIVGVAASWAIGYPIVYICNAAMVCAALKIKWREMFFATLPAASAALVMSVVTWTGGVLFLDSLPPIWHVMIEALLGTAVFITSLSVISRSAVHEALQFARDMVSGSG